MKIYRKKLSNRWSWVALKLVKAGGKYVLYKRGQKWRFDWSKKRKKCFSLFIFFFVPLSNFVTFLFHFGGGGRTWIVDRGSSL